MKIVVFDLDHTLVRVNSSYYFVRYLNAQSQLSSMDFAKVMSFYAMYFVGLIPLKKLFGSSLSLLENGLSKEQLQRAALSFVNNVLMNKISLPVLQRLQEAKKRGDVVAILSTSPAELVKAVALHLEISHWGGSYPHLLIDGEQKLHWVLNLVEKVNLNHPFALTLADVIVYSDSSRDLPLLSYVGKPVMVNPDRRLRRLGDKKGWEILCSR